VQPDSILAQYQGQRLKIKTVVDALKYPQPKRSIWGKAGRSVMT